MARQENQDGNPYGYDPDTETVRVHTRALARLLRQFRKELEKNPGYEWWHMGDYDITFEELADAVDYAEMHRPAGVGYVNDKPERDSRLRCKRAPGYRWPDDQAPYNGQPVSTYEVREDPIQDQSHYAWTGHGFGYALCGFTFTEEDGITCIPGPATCPVCVREKRLADELPRE